MQWLDTLRNSLNLSQCLYRPPSVLHLHLALNGWYDHLEDTNLKLVVGCDGQIRLRRTEGGCIVMDTTCIVMDTTYSYVIIFLYFIDPNI